VSRDLETICLKCLEKEHRQRYPTARALADDLERALQQEPILARRATAWERAAKWTRRNPAAARIAALAVSTALVSSVGIVIWRSREAVARAQAQRQADEREALARDEAREQTMAERREGARQQAEAAWQALIGAGEDTNASDRLGLALSALQSAQGWRDAAEDQAEAQAALFEAALALGAIASETEQWALAEQALGQAAGLGVDDTHAKRLLDEARAARDAEAAARATEVRDTLAWVSSGRARLMEQGLVEAVFRITRHPHLDTVALLSDELDRLSRRLLELQVETYMSVYEPNQEERARGEGVVEGLPEAVQEMERRLFQGGADPDPRPIEAAARRWLARQGRPLDPSSIATTALGPALSAGISDGDRDAIQVVCESLGRIGIEAVAILALERYMQIETSPARASTAGVALARLNTERSLTLLDWATRRYRSEAFHLRVTKFTQAIGTATRTAAAQANTVEEHVDRAQRNYLLGRLAEAVEDYSRAISLAPELALLYANRGGLLQQVGRVQEALNDLRRALELDPSSVTAWNNLGRTYEGQGALRQALPAYDKALELDPSQVMTLENRARVRRGLRDMRGALEDFGRALDYQPDNASLLSQRALTHAMLGDYPAALRDFDRALEVDPNMEAALLNRGKLRREMGDLPGSLEDMTRAVELSPNSSWAFAQRGRVRLELKDDGAIEDLERALQLDPRNFDAHVFVGLYHQQAGRLEPAIQAFQSALRVDPRNPQVPAVRQTLQELEAQR
jgi:tetratricopeptide (TPR) repeat protein